MRGDGRAERAGRRVRVSGFRDFKSFVCRAGSYERLGVPPVFVGASRAREVLAGPANRLQGRLLRDWDLRGFRRSEPCSRGFWWGMTNRL